jgi:hypothetical protein
MKDEALAQALFRSLLVLRVTLGIFLLQWGIEKFVMLGNTPAIWGLFLWHRRAAGCGLPSVHRQRAGPGSLHRPVPAAALGSRRLR